MARRGTGVGRWLAMASMPPVGEMLRRVLRILRRGLTPRTAVGAAGIVAGGFIASRLLGLLRSVAIAEAFGTEPELGAYWVAFRLPDTIFQLLAGATLSAAFIPTFSRVVLRESEDEGWWLASSVLNLIAIATFVAAAIGFLLAPLVVPLLRAGAGRGERARGGAERARGGADAADADLTAAVRHLRHVNRHS